MKTILVFAGTRPEIIKMAPVVHELRRRHSKNVRTCFCFTGQHVELALPFLKFFELEADACLQLMNPGQSLGQLSARAAAQLDAFFDNESACCALVQGDTTTAFVAALVAFYHRVPVGHVEAGLRTQDISEPFPEELNRRLITRIATWHYAPTLKARQSLLEEKVPEPSILVTGNTGIDALLLAVNRSAAPQALILGTLEARRLVLVTAHRRENIGLPLINITQALVRLASRFPEVHFVVPIHKNPQVAETVRGVLSGIDNVHLTEPLSYGDLVWTMKRAELILSDSGGIQEEAPSLHKPVLVLRNETERPEAVEYGTSIMVGSDPELIFATADAFLTGRCALRHNPAPNPYGDGKAASRIVDHLLESLEPKLPKKRITPRRDRIVSA